MLPEPIKKFIELFAKLPSIGPRQATRLAFYFVSLGKNRLEEMSRAIADLKTIKICADCFYIHANKESLCSICADTHRRKDLIMIVEKETDVISIERTKRFNGRYLVLGELTRSGVLESAQKLRLAALKNFVQKNLGGMAGEIIIATNPTTYGDLTAMIISKELQGLAKKITRLGRGIPTGGEIEFADEDTLGQALERRI